MNTLTTDPVCGMEVEIASSLSAEHEGRTHYFCSEKCRVRFVRNPEAFARPDSEEAQPTGGNTRGEKVRQNEPGAKWTNYLPLLVIVALTLLAACAKQYAYFDGAGWDWMRWMHDFMGLFLVVFSMLKFFNLEGFADGFQRYDLLAKPLRLYAHVYPFLELSLGLGYLAQWQPRFIYCATIAVMSFGSLGVFNALRKGLDLDCACMGTVLKVPLSTVALIEDLSMVAMAAAMLLLR